MVRSTECLISLALYGNANALQLPFSNLVEEFKISNVRTIMQYKLYKDPKSGWRIRY